MHNSILLAVLLPLLALASPRPQVSVSTPSTTGLSTSTTTSLSTSFTTGPSAPSTTSLSTTSSTFSTTSTGNPRTTSTTSCDETWNTTSSTRSYSSTTLVTVSATLTVTPSSSSTSTTTSAWNSTTSTTSTTSSTASTSAVPPGEGPVRSVPDGPFSVVGVRNGARIDLSPMVARNYSFYLGGDTAAYCPSGIPSCPPGTDTVFRETCSMYVSVPGGQQVFASPDGSIGYTHPHSTLRPVGSELCPFIYSKQDGDEFGTMTTDVFGARGLMACPTDSEGTEYKVFAAMPNATVPTGNIANCVGFLAIAPAYDDGTAAYEYN